MSVINLNEVGKEKLNELAAKGTMRGLLVEYVGSYERLGNIRQGGGYTEYEFLTTSASDGAREHTVYLYKQGGIWWGECDRDTEEGCEANQKGGKVCSHIALATAQLKKYRDNPKLWEQEFNETWGLSLEKERQEVFEG